MDYLILSNIPQLANPALFCEFPWNHKLEHEENEGLTLLGNDTLLCRNLLHSHCAILLRYSKSYFLIS